MKNPIFYVMIRRPCIFNRCFVWTLYLENILCMDGAHPLDFKFVMLFSILCISISNIDNLKFLQIIDWMFREQIAAYLISLSLNSI